MLGRDELYFIGASVYCRDLTVLINDNEGRRVGTERDKVGYDTEAGGTECEGWCRVGVGE